MDEMSSRAMASLALGLALAASASFGGARAQTTATMALPDCLGKPVVKPTTVTFACGDGNFLIEKLRWTGWGESFAAATGTFEANDCTPNCAAGHFHAYKGVIVASGSQKCPDGTQAYATVRYAFFGRAPFGANAPGSQDPSQTFTCKPH